MERCVSVVILGSWGFLLILCPSSPSNPIVVDFFPFSLNTLVNSSGQTKRLYRISSFFVGRTTGELPITLFFPLIYTLGAWLMVQFHPIDDILRAVIEFLLLSVVTMFAATSLGYFAGSLTHDLDVAICVLIVVMVPMFLMNGFIVDPSVIPPAIAWSKYLSLFYWSFRVYISWCWQDVDLKKCTSAEILQFPDDCGYKNGNDVLKHRFDIDVGAEPYVFRDSILVLLVYSVVLRVLAFFRIWMRYEVNDNWARFWKRVVAGLAPGSSYSSAREDGEREPRPRPSTVALREVTKGMAV